MKFRRASQYLFVAASLCGTLLAACNRDPNVVKQKYLESGMRYYSQGKYKEAGIQFQNAIKIDPRFVAAHYQMALCFEKLEIYSGAYQELVKTIDIQGDDIPARAELGNLLLAAHRYEEAKEQAEAILSNDPRNVDGRLLRANTFAAVGDLNAALKECQVAAQIAPNRGDVFLTLAEANDRLGHVQDAESDFKRAIDLERSPRVTTAFGAFYDRHNRAADAEQMYKLAIHLNLKDPSLRQELAVHYLRAGQQAQAEEALRQAKQDFSQDSAGYRLLGDFYAFERQPDKALAEYASLYHEHPKDLDIQKRYVELLIASNKYDEASRLTDGILKSNSKDRDGLVFRAEILTRQGKPSDAIPVLDSVVKADPVNSVAHYELAQAYRTLGDTTREELELRQAVQIQPSLVQAQEELAQIATAKRDASSLSAAADELISVRPLWPEGYAYRSQSKLAGGDIAGAEADAQRAITLAPHSPLGYVALAQLRYSQKRYPDAQKLFEQALAQDPDYLNALEGIVAAYMLQKQPDKAVDRVQQQISESPSNARYQLLYARLLIGDKKYEAAESAAQKAVDLSPKDTTSILFLAAAQAHRGEFDKEAATYEQAIKANPGDARTYFLYASFEDARGNWQKAEELDQKALQLQPELALASNDLAYLMLEHGGSVDIALSIAQKARQEQPENPNFGDTLAWAYYQKGAYSSAVSLLEESVKAQPQIPLFHYHLGLSYQKLNDKARAKGELQRFLQLDPKDSHADGARKALSELG